MYKNDTIHIQNKTHGQILGKSTWNLPIWIYHQRHRAILFVDVNLGDRTIKCYKFFKQLLTNWSENSPKFNIKMLDISQIINYSKFVIYIISTFISEAIVYYTTCYKSYIYICINLIRIRWKE